MSRLESDADESVGRAFAGSGKQVESLQAISSFWVQWEWLQSVRDVCWPPLKMLTACSDLHSPVYRTKVTFTCRQGRPAGSQFPLLPEDPAFVKPRWEGFEGCWLLLEVDSGTCFLYCRGACNSWGTSLGRIRGSCTASVSPVFCHQLAGWRPMGREGKVLILN